MQENQECVDIFVYGIVQFGIIQNNWNNLK